MARFVRDGLLRVDDLVPRELCAEAAAEIASGSHRHARAQGAAPFREVWSDPDFDLALWWTRIENTPETIYRTQLA